MPRPPLVLTAFEPFGGRRRNVSEVVARALAEELEVPLLVLPVRFGQLSAEVRRALALRPRRLLMLGEAWRATALRIERVALNLADARLPDNAGDQPRDVPVVRGDVPARFVTLDPKRLHAWLRSAGRGAGATAELSLSAGAFACNAALFHALRHAARSTEVGFIHVPAAKGAPKPAELVRALRPAVRTLAEARAESLGKRRRSR